MNNTTISPSDAAVITEAEAMNKVNYGLIVFVCVLFVIIVVSFLSFACTRVHRQQLEHWPSQVSFPVTPTDHVDRDNLVPIDVGLDEAALRSIPKLPYSQAKAHNGESTASCCSICLGDYKESDILRLLPDCGHLFHLKCVDPWLRLHPTCPVCRKSPIPSPIPTPLAELAPVAAQRVRVRVGFINGVFIQV